MLGLALGLAAAADTVAQPPLKRVVFLTNYVFHGRHAPFFVGLEKGFYREHGFDLQIRPATGSGFVVSALEGGKADYGMADASAVVQAVAKGSKVRGFGVFMDVTTSGLAALVPHPTPASLTGKTIAASLTDSARVIVPIVLSLGGLDPGLVRWQAADPGVYASLLLERRVDLVTATIDGDLPALTRVAAPRGQAIHFASFAEWGYDVYGFLLVTTADRVATQPEEVRAFGAATVKAVRYAMDRPDETAQIMVKHNPTLDPTTTLAQWRQSIKAIDTASVRRHGYGVATSERLQRTIDLLTQAFRLGVRLTPADVYVPGLIDPS